MDEQFFLTCHFSIGFCFAAYFVVEFLGAREVARERCVW